MQTALSCRKSDTVRLRHTLTSATSHITQPLLSVSATRFDVYKVTNNRNANDLPLFATVANYHAESCVAQHGPGFSRYLTPVDQTWNLSLISIHPLYENDQIFLHLRNYLCNIKVELKSIIPGNFVQLITCSDILHTSFFSRPWLNINTQRGSKVQLHVGVHEDAAINDHQPHNATCIVARFLLCNYKCALLCPSHICVFVTETHTCTHTH